MLANGIADTGVAATIMVLDAQGPLRSLVAPAVGIVDLGRGRKLKMALALPAILSALSKTRPAVLVASEASGNALAVIATRLLPRSRRPRLVLREVASPMQARTNDPYVQNRLAYRLAPWLYPRADLVVALTEPVRGDASQLSQLLHNVIGNAMKYGREGTPILVSLTPEGDSMVRLTVTDQGEGIAPEHLPRLTERFYRVDSGRSRTLGGTGLGLAIVKHIVERHRGRFDIASTVGKGSTVTVLLPVHRLS